MERVAFLIEDTGEHLGCLLNPETVVMQRTAGVEPRRSAGGKLTGTGLADDPLLFTGGGHTELRLDLLFDVDLAPASLYVQDVRQMTRPIWALAENSAEVERQRRPPSVRFVWGRAWNVPGIVTEVAERFDRFSPDGSPLRSWMRMVFVRVGQSADQEGGENYELAQRLPTVDLTAPPVDTLAVGGDGSTDRSALAPDGGEPVPEVPPGELGRLSLAAFGTPLLWKLLLEYNNIDDPSHFNGPLAVPPVGEAP
ncbi:MULTISPECIES: hypothetical protein [Arthrobacter]|uniref:Contractile injection system tube protein N-terminal domain-containing protein n=1 Tax=Arthrobacter terricola TaxID=2547396 RepID=A0A4R5KHL9_9MICC|nr:MULTISPECIES: hypothetical protein [Arthrobacter]MBT8162049.1 hypothetical protein [Arthrobacter sp. GN70]TDF94562.1 hypothetical protein E1809_13500 [Arthrobacter terricola]